METRKEIALEKTVRFGHVEVTPVVRTVTCRSFGSLRPFVIMAMEPCGTIVNDGRETMALMIDGRRLTLAELSSEYPSLASRLAGLTPSGPESRT